jgi:hypothetical protein
VGYPVVLSIYNQKKMYGKLRKSFNVEHMSNYLNDIISGKVRMNTLPAL